MQTCYPEGEGLRLVVEYTLRGNIAAEQPIEVELSQVQATETSEM